MSLPQGIPSLDLANYVNGTAEQRQKFIQDIGQAYEDIGFVAIRNHGINDDLIAKFYTSVKAFFALPEEVKKKYEIEGIGGQRGYTSFGKEHAKQRNTGDLKEFWHFGQFVDDEDPLKDEYPENVYVVELPEFMAVGREAYQTFERQGAVILSALAQFLGLHENFFDAHIHNGNSVLRPIHYPPITNSEPDAVRAGEHEDINLITLLVGASADGLQVLNRENEWVDVKNIENHIVVNVGDMLQRLTNNRLRSTTHRVINPPVELQGTSRFSIPFFLHPRPEMRLDCLESCITAENPRQYEDISSDEYLKERLREIGLIK
jgi:isopenicillin N synthase-like dioxygenase